MKARDPGRRETPGKVLKDRRAPGERGRMGTGVRRTRLGERLERRAASLVAALDRGVDVLSRPPVRVDALGYVALVVVHAPERGLPVERIPDPRGANRRGYRGELDAVFRVERDARAIHTGVHVHEAPDVVRELVHRVLALDEDAHAHARLVLRTSRDVADARERRTDRRVRDEDVEMAKRRRRLRARVLAVVRLHERRELSRRRDFELVDPRAQELAPHESRLGRLEVRAVPLDVPDDVHDRLDVASHRVEVDDERGGEHALLELGGEPERRLDVDVLEPRAVARGVAHPARGGGAAGAEDVVCAGMI